MIPSSIIPLHTGFVNENGRLFSFSEQIVPFLPPSFAALFGICVDTLTIRENTFSGKRYNQVVLNICKNVTLDEKTLKNSTLTDVVE